MAKIVVFSTRGKKRTEIFSDAETWGQLEKDLNAAGIETKGFKKIVGETQNSLESSAAVLPKGLTSAGEVVKDFTLFLTPIKVKSGAVVNVDDMSYWDCRNFIKEEFAASEEAKAHFAGYTNKDTGTLRSLIMSWTSKGSEAIEAGETDQSLVNYIDAAIANLTVLRSRVEAGEAVKEEVVDEIQVLSEKWAEIEANL